MSLYSRAYGALRQQATEIYRKCRSSIPASWYAFGGALYESATGKRAPGAGRRIFFAHQHTPETGGVPLAVGLCGGFGGGSSSGWVKTIDNADAGTWFEISEDRDPHWKVEVSLGVDYRKTSANGATCALEARIWVELTGAASSGNIRIFNQTTGTYSSSASFSSGHTRSNAIVDIDVQPGENDLIAEVRTNTTGGTVTLHECLFYQIEGNSQPRSAGTADYDSLTRP